MVNGYAIKRCSEEDCDKVFHILKQPQNDDFILNSFVIKQKERHVFFAGVPAKVLDMMCDVPSINFREWSNSEISEKALNSQSRGFNWQRELEFNRIEDLHTFFDNDENYIVNPVIIVLREVDILPNIPRDQNSCSTSLTIPPWMKNKCPECGRDFQDESGSIIYQDRCSDHNCQRHEISWQPAIIIDGQHRIRGIPFHSQGHYIEELIPTIILSPAEFDPADQAKLFTEITTKAEELHKLHQMLLQYRFNIPPLDNVNNNDKRWAYEICLYLNCLGDINTNPVHEKISIVPYKTGFISADQACPVLKNYYEGCLVDYNQNPGGAAEQLIHYFSAIKNIWPNAWGRSPHGWLNQRGVFKVILELYDVIHTRVKKYQSSRFTISNFRTELLYGENIAWGVDTAWDKFVAPDKHLRILYNILKDRFDSQIVTPDFSDINEYIKMKPEDPNVHLIPADRMIDGIKIKWKQPVNAFSTPDIKITQAGSTHNISISPASVSRNSEITLKAGEYFKIGAGDVTIEIEFKNHTEAVTKKTINLPS